MTAPDRQGLIYLLQRGDKADPIAVMNRNGELTGAHGMDVMPNGELLVGPGPDAKAPQWFRKPAAIR